MTPAGESPTFVHVDDHVLAVEKPAGLLAVPGRGPENADCLSARVQALYPEALVVHRLDMATSGLMLFARSAAVQRLLGLAFQERTVSKRYEAIVHGMLAAAAASASAAATEDWSCIDLPIGPDWPNRPRQRIDTTTGKPSQTRYRVLPAAGSRRADGIDNPTTRLQLEPVTGRTHQLRVHLSAIGHTIVGDALYGPPTREPRLLLHAAGLRLVHPVTNRTLELDSATPF